MSILKNVTTIKHAGWLVVLILYVLLPHPPSSSIASQPYTYSVSDTRVDKQVSDQMKSQFGGSGSGAIIELDSRIAVGTAFEMVLLKVSELRSGGKDIVDARIELPQMPVALKKDVANLYAMMPTEGIARLDLGDSFESTLYEFDPGLNIKRAVDFALVGGSIVIAHDREMITILDVDEVTGLRRLGSYRSRLSRLWSIGSVDDIVILSGASGLELVDIAEPEEPKALGFLEFDGAGLDLLVLESMVVVAQGNHGISFVDIRNPEAPRIESRLTVDINFAWISQLDSYGSSIYAVDSQQDMLLSIDGSNPAVPKITQQLEMPSIGGPLAAIDGLVVLTTDTPAGVSVITSDSDAKQEIISDRLRIRDDDWMALAVATGHCHNAGHPRSCGSPIT